MSLLEQKSLDNPVVKKQNAQNNSHLNMLLEQIYS